MLSALLTLSLVALATASPEDVQRALESALDDDTLQREWPDQRSPGSGTVRSDELEPEADSGPRVPHAAAPIANAVLWAIAIVTVLLLAAWLGVTIVQHRGEGRAPPTPVASSADGARAAPAPPLELPARLAAEGRYAEALHAMLLRAQARLLVAAPAIAREDLTSRELLSELDHVTPRPDEQRIAGLRDLVGAVELTHFGGRATTQADYERHLPAYRAATGEGERQSS